MKYILISLLCVLGCDIKTINTDEIKNKTDLLLDKIANGTANEDFLVEYFPIEQTEGIMYDLKNKCDFKNRHGHFLNEYYSADKSKLSLIYEYYLKCDSIRFIISYKLNEVVELCEFKMEPIEKPNAMITDSTKCLLYSTTAK